jgi:hypothetical protein
MRAVGGGVVIALLSIGCTEPPPAAPVAVSSPAKPTAAEIRSSGTPISSKLDVDGDGTVGAQTDAILIHRYIAGFRGEPLVKDAVNAGCQRCTAEQIAAYLDSF